MVILFKSKGNGSNIEPEDPIEYYNYLITEIEQQQKEQLDKEKRRKNWFP